MDVNPTVVIENATATRLSSARAAAVATRLALEQTYASLGGRGRYPLLLGRQESPMECEFAMHLFHRATTD